MIFDSVKNNLEHWNGETEQHPEVDELRIYPLWWTWGRLLIKNSLLHILIGTFMSAVVGRFPAILVSIVVITSIAFVLVLFFAFVLIFIFWIWFFFCFHHSRRRIKWFTRGECFCRRIIWQENCFQGRGPPLTMRLMMMMMCQKCFCLLKTS